jgi:signal transduction histidine kinase
LVSHLLQKTEELEHAHDNLYKLHHDRTRFVCNLSHELKTPLTSVLGYADLLVNFYDQIEPDRVSEYLSGIHQEALHLESLLSGMLRLFAIDSGSENWNWQELDLVAAVIDCLQSHELGQAELALDLDCVMAEDLQLIWGDPDRVALLLDSLFDNAIKFNRPGGSIRLRSENRDLNGSPMVYLSISNEGTTVPQESAEEIFQQYTQLGGLDSGKPSGVGIGLATCRAILRQMHGDIFLEPMSGEGTSLGVLLPTRQTYEDKNNAQRRI